MIQRSVKLPKNRHFFLFGPRQVGKSTLLKEHFSQENTVFYDLLDTDLYMQLLARPAVLREQVNKLEKDIIYIVIDEIQKVPDLLDEVHKLIEERKDLRFILSGSSARKLKRVGANMLAGRALNYELHPLTHEELLDDFDLQRALELGTLASVYLDREDDSFFAKQTLKSYVKTYLEQEIKAEAQLRNIGAFVRFLDLASHENGHVVNASNIARDIHVDYKTVQEYYQVLEDTLMGFSLFGYAKSKRKQISKQPKFYFFDTGVQRALAKKLDLTLVPKTKEFGAAFEHFLICEIKRALSYSFCEAELSYFKTKSGAEVDLIVDFANGNCLAIEIKATDSVNLSKLTGLKAFHELRPEAKLFCASLASQKSGDDLITIVPWQELLKNILLKEA